MENKKRFRPNPDSRLMDQVKEVLRYHHYAYRTEKMYCQWILQYIQYHEERLIQEKWGDNKWKPFYQIWLLKEMWRHLRSVRL